jgi:hypothetical protein
MKRFAWIVILVLSTFEVGDSEARGYSLIIGTVRPVVRQGDAIAVEVKVSNDSDESGWIDFGESASDYEIAMYDSEGKALRKSVYGQRMSRNVSLGSRLVRFAPGAVRTLSLDVGTYFDLPGPGVYTIQLSRLQLRSNAVVVTVLPAELTQSGGGSNEGASLLSAAGAPGDSTSRGQARDGLSLHIDVDRATVVVGREIPIVTYLRNASPRALVFPFSVPELEYEFDIRNSKGELVPKSALRQARDAHLARFGSQKYPFSLQPGGGLSADIDVAKNFVLDAPGVYTVQSYWRVPDEAGGGEIRSNRLLITVLAAQVR